MHYITQNCTCFMYYNAQNTLFFEYSVYFEAKNYCNANRVHY